MIPRNEGSACVLLLILVIASLMECLYLAGDFSSSHSFDIKWTCRIWFSLSDFGCMDNFYLSLLILRIRYMYRETNISGPSDHLKCCWRDSKVKDIWVLYHSDFFQDIILNQKGGKLKFYPRVIKFTSYSTTCKHTS